MKIVYYKSVKWYEVNIGKVAFGFGGQKKVKWCKDFTNSILESLLWWTIENDSVAKERRKRRANKGQKKQRALNGLRTDRELSLELFIVGGDRCETIWS